MKPAPQQLHHHPYTPCAGGPKSGRSSQATPQGFLVLMVLRLACLMAATLETPLLSPFW